VTRLRLLWAAAIVFTVVLWAAVLAVPAIILLLPNQWQGDSLTAPPEIIVRQVLATIAPALQTAALVMLGSLVVVAVVRREPSAKRAGAGGDPDGWDDAVLLEEPGRR
jgi:ABC-type Fe3+ transport system permease subunit